MFAKLKDKHDLIKLRQYIINEIAEIENNMDSKQKYDQWHQELINLKYQAINMKIK